MNGFDFEGLEAYRVARRVVAMAAGLALPRGEGDLADQLKRAAASVVLNTAEGAGRRTGREKARFYDIARGSATECAAILDVLGIRGAIDPAREIEARMTLHRLVRLLAGLARSALQRAR